MQKNMFLASNLRCVASERGTDAEASRVRSTRRCSGGCWARGDLVMQRDERVQINFRERGERLDRVAQHIDRHARADGKRRLLQPLAGLRAERISASELLAVAE